MGVIDTLTPYTTSRLVAWGSEIRGGGEWLGLPRVNLLHRDHLPGGSPRRVAIGEETWMTELIVNEIGAESPECAAVLRACYCGSGRWLEERRRRAERIIGRRLSRRRFIAIHNDAHSRVRWFFEQMARIAA